MIAYFCRWLFVISVVFFVVGIVWLIPVFGVALYFIVLWEFANDPSYYHHQARNRGRKSRKGGSCCGK
jgi:type IV secretory pathway TrbD component